MCSHFTLLVEYSALKYWACLWCLSGQSGYHLREFVRRSWSVCVQRSVRTVPPSGPRTYPVAVPADVCRCSDLVAAAVQIGNYNIHTLPHTDAFCSRQLLYEQFLVLPHCFRLYFISRYFQYFCLDAFKAICSRFFCM